jgi:hypothetical protein
MNGWNYVLRILKGESPREVLASMPDRDFNKVSDLVGGLRNTNLPRQQRRAIERKFKSLKR